MFAYPVITSCHYNVQWVYHMRFHLHTYMFTSLVYTCHISNHLDKLINHHTRYTIYYKCKYNKTE